MTVGVARHSCSERKTKRVALKGEGCSTRGVVEDQSLVVGGLGEVYYAGYEREAGVADLACDLPASFRWEN